MTQEQLFGAYFLATVIIGAALLAWLIYWVYRAKLLEREERRLMIERGLAPPASAPTGWPAVRAREQELKFEERRLRIEKGLDIGSPPPDTPVTRPEDYLRKGLIASSLGAGIAIGYQVFLNSGFDVSSVEMRNWMLFFAVISPVLGLFGVANLLYYKLTKRRGGVEPIAPGPDR
jgi:hypothetical protein